MKYNLKNMGFGYELKSRLFEDMGDKIVNRGKISQNLNEKIRVHIIGRILSPQFIGIYQTIHVGLLDRI